MQKLTKAAVSANPLLSNMTFPNGDKLTSYLSFASFDWPVKSETLRVLNEDLT